MLTDLLRAHRRDLHTQWRALPCDRQALLVVARLRKNETYLDLAAGFEIGVATVCRYVHEAVDLLELLAATLFKVTKDWVYDEVEAGRLPHVKLGRKHLRFRRRELETYLAGHLRPAVPRREPNGPR